MPAGAVTMYRYGHERRMTNPGPRHGRLPRFYA